MENNKKSCVAIGTRTYETYSILCPYCFKLIRGDENIKNTLKIKCPECGKEIDVEYNEKFKNKNAPTMKDINKLIEDAYMRLTWYEMELDSSNSLMRKSYLDGKIETLKWILESLKLERFED